ncbi:sialate O-acetylesterase [Jiella pelagia]|uniref:Sialate O-acetylesterase domain-containing protein n=1 Tax=Jiella pelagia TaxID=2986949 RepID=A0ABY7BUV0_9HYPH|nr:sialate O-acetylesterase [Jiella pelagia]WAP67239.1 hypothetical protein OH818_16820 [Jiella pelagia]
MLDTKISAIQLSAAYSINFVAQVIRAQATGNVNLASGLTAGTAIDGVTVSAGDHVFLGSQADPAENGIYTVVSSGAASRAGFANSAAELARIGFAIREGTEGQGRTWSLPLDEADITIGTTDLEFSLIVERVDPSDTASNIRYVAETTTGSPDLLSSFTVSPAGYRLSGKQYAEGGTLDTVDLYMQEVGSPTIYVYSRSGTTFSPVASVSLGSKSVGQHNGLVVDLDIPAGGFVGLQPDGVGVKLGQWPAGVYLGSAETFSAASVTTTGNQSLCTFNVTETVVATGTEYRESIIGSISVEPIDEIEVTDAVRLGSPSLSTPFVVILAGWRANPRVFADGGTLETVDVHMAESGSPTIYTYTRAGTTFVPYRSVSLGSLSPGPHYGLAVNLDIPVGGFVGINPTGLYVRIGQWPEGVYIGGAETFSAASITTTGNQAACTFHATETRRVPLATYLDELSAATVLSPSAARPYVVSPDLYPASYLYAGGAGQSNMLGVATAITTRAEYGAKGFSVNDGTLKSLTAPGVGSTEYPGFGLAAYLRRRMMAEGLASNAGGTCPIIVGRNALGGTEIQYLDKPSTYYTAGLTQLSAAKAAANAASQPFRHLGQAWFQGEQDAGQGTAKATYKGLLAQFAVDYDADSRAAVSGDYDRATFVVQITAPLDLGTEAAWGIAMAQKELGAEHPLISLVCPAYVGDYIDSRHVSAQSSRRIGAYLARAMMLGRKSEPLMVVDSYISGNDIVLVYNRDGLKLDTTLRPAQTRSGFRVWNGVDVEQTSFTVAVDSRGDRVRLTCSPTPNEFYYWSYGHIMATGMSPYGGGAGNLRDSAGDTDVFEGWPLHNWAILEEGSV